MQSDVGAVERLGQGVGEHVRQVRGAGPDGDAAGGPVQRGAGRGLHGECAGHRGGREARVGQREPEGVQVADEAGVHHGDPLLGRRLGEQLGGAGGVTGRADVKTQCAQVGLERRPGDRRTGEDGGRQTNSLLGC
ncbi:hypothetical protein SAZ_35165 [Streptomyces noursei ZPM]|nr:hypothetical protein SAZ_35165 [Streptomyces noursei ZPM]